MIYRQEVTSNSRPVSPEWNADHVYIRYDVTTRQVEVEGETVTEYVYNEIMMSVNEYHNLQAGTLPISVPEWDDQLRAIERGALYDEADRMISKYGTDVPDTAKRDAWIAYKHSVRATQDAPGYPQTVEYPFRPERSRMGGGIPLPLYSFVLLLVPLLQDLQPLPLRRSARRSVRVAIRVDPLRATIDVLDNELISPVGQVLITIRTTSNSIAKNNIFHIGRIPNPRYKI